MDDLKRITVSELRYAVSFASDNLPIAFNDNARGPNFQFLKERGDSKSVSDFSFLAVDFQFHSNKKTASAAASQSCQGIRFQVCPALRSRDGDSHASLRRCDPDQVQRVT